MVAGLAAGVVLSLVCAATGSMRPATTAVKIKALPCIFIWSPLASLVACLPFLRATSLNTRHWRMLRGIGNNRKRARGCLGLLKAMNHGPNVLRDGTNFGNGCSKSLRFKVQLRFAIADRGSRAARRR